MKQTVKALAGRKGGMKRVSKGFATMDVDERKAASAKGNKVRWKTGTPSNKYEIQLAIKTMETVGLMDRSWPESFVVPFDIEIRREPEDAAGCVIGFAIAHLVLIGAALDHGCPLFEVLDSLGATQVLMDLYEDVHHADYSKEVLSKFEGLAGRGLDLLFIDHIEINPEFRGFGVGLLVSRILSDYLSNSSSLVVMSSPPKLAKYFEKAGFRRIQSSVNNLSAISPGEKQPNITKYLSFSKLAEMKPVTGVTQ